MLPKRPKDWFFDYERFKNSYLWEIYSWSFEIYGDERVTFNERNDLAWRRLNDRTRQISKLLDETVNNRDRASGLDMAFTWENTPQGDDFWNEIFEQFEGEMRADGLEEVVHLPREAEDYLAQLHDDLMDFIVNPDRFTEKLKELVWV